MNRCLVNDFIDAVRREYLLARERHAPFNSAHEGWAVIKEELDELWDEVLKKRHERDDQNMAKECVQIAAMATAFALEVVQPGVLSEVLPISKVYRERAGDV